MKSYTDEDIIQITPSVYSCAELLKRLGLKPTGGNYASMKKKLAKLAVDCSHWKGQGWSNGQKLKNWESYKTINRLKKHMISELGRQCDICGNETWLDEPISLELHHLDGDRTNNSFDNLQLLCPNCHSFTNNWRGRKRSDQVKIRYRRDIRPIEKKDRSKINWPAKEELIEMIKSQSLTSLARQLGVSDNSIRKHAKKIGIDIQSISKWSKRHGSATVAHHS